MDRKNTLLLTVIAIATLLVAVVGATFAFFTSQNTGKADTNVNVKTETVNTATIYEGEAINLKANMTNFKQDLAKVREEGTYGTSEPYVKYSRGTGDDDAKLCYKATLVVTKNDFAYSAANVEPHKPELVLEVSKVTKEANTIEEVTDPATPVTKIENLTYMTEPIKLFSTADKKNMPEATGTEDITVQGFDITEAGKDATGDDENAVKFRIPAKDAASDPNDYIFEINPSDKDKTVIDKWVINAYIINHDFDQSDNAGTYDAETGTTTPKEFNAYIRFETATCPVAP